MLIFIKLYELIHYFIHPNINNFYIHVSIDIILVSIFLGLIISFIVLLIRYFQILSNATYSLFQLFKNHINIINKSIVQLFKIVKINFFLLIFISLVLFIYLTIIYIDPTNKYSYKKVTIYENSIIKDINNNIIDFIYKDQIRIFKPIDKIDKKLVTLVLFAEDDKFYDHIGFDIYEISNSIKTNLENKRFVRGASTVTQQLVKNMFLTKEKSLKRKLIELVLAIKVESDFTKEDIIEYYLNIIEWGPGIYGAEAAAQYYFDKSSEDLTLSEAIFLTLIIPNPKLYSPFYKPENLKIIKAREKHILKRLYNEKHLNYKDEVNQTFNIYKNRDSSDISHSYPKFDIFSNEKNFLFKSLESYLSKIIKDLYKDKYLIKITIDKKRQIAFDKQCTRINTLFKVKELNNRFNYIALFNKESKIIAISKINTFNKIIKSKIEAKLFSGEFIKYYKDIPWKKILIDVKKKKKIELKSKT